MECYKVTGNNKLKGLLQIQGSKNAALPILTACLLGDGIIYLQHCPDITDIFLSEEMLRFMGVKIKKQNDITELDAREVSFCGLEGHLAKQMRSSVLFLGAMIGRFGIAKVPYPGGCRIGKRPIDIHLFAFQQLGIRIQEDGGEILAKGYPTGGRVCLPFPSVGATQNIMLASMGAKADVVIEHAAKEPEIWHLAEFLNRCGASIDGAGTETIRISAGKRLHGCTYKIPGDRIVAGTYLIAACATKGSIAIKGALCKELGGLIAELEKRGSSIFCEEDVIYLEQKKRAYAGMIETAPYPGFPTDLQSAMTVLSSVSDGDSKVVETIFENRFGIVNQLINMNAAIRYQGKNAILIRGRKNLDGARVYSGDLRQGAALIVAGLVANGETIVYDKGYIKRGYEDIAHDICSLGGSVRLEKERIDEKIQY